MVVSFKNVSLNLGGVCTMTAVYLALLAALLVAGGAVAYSPELVLWLHVLSAALIFLGALVGIWRRRSDLLGEQFTALTLLGGMLTFLVFASYTQNAGWIEYVASGIAGAMILLYATVILRKRRAHAQRFARAISNTEFHGTRRFGK